jgi:hypothetical protein
LGLSNMPSGAPRAPGHLQPPGRRATAGGSGLAFQVGSQDAPTGQTHQLVRFGGVQSRSTNWWDLSVSKT